jgi:hypothetical protein
MKTLPQSAVFGLVAVPPMRAAEEPQHPLSGAAAPGGAPALAGETPSSALATAALVGLVLAAAAALALFASETRAIGQATGGRNVPPTAPNAVRP